MDTAVSAQKLSDWWFIKLLKGFAIFVIVIIVGTFAFMASAPILPSPLKEWGENLSASFTFNTGGPLSGTWITDENKICSYTLLKDSISIAKIEGTCKLSIFDSRNGLHANLDFTYKNTVFITQDASLRRTVTSMKPDELNVRYKLQEGKFESNQFSFKSFLRTGAIYEFNFLVDGEDMTTTKANTIPGTESNVVRFAPESLVFIKQKPGLFQ